MSWIV